MHHNDLTKYYDRLTAPERFALVLAAAGRNDHSELRRLMQTAPRRNYSVPHHAPLVDAFLNLSKLHFMELLDTAAGYLGTFAPSGRQRGKGTDPLEGRREMLLLGYLFRTYLEGWRQFCAALQVDPEFQWKSWPGYPTVKRAERLSGPNAETGRLGAAYTEEGARRHLARWTLGLDAEAELDADTWQTVPIVTPTRLAQELRVTWEHGLQKWGVVL